MSGPPPPFPVMSSSFTHRVERSPLLDRLQAFLPQLKAANEQLEEVCYQFYRPYYITGTPITAPDQKLYRAVMDIKTHGAAKYSFEDTTGCENPIRLQLSIGVLEQQKIDPQKDQQTAEQAEMNPHNLAILPSEIDQRKKQDTQGPNGGLVMPWQITGNSSQDQPPQQTTKPSLVEEANMDSDSGNDEDDETDIDNDMGEGETVPKPKKKKLRKSHQPNPFETETNQPNDSLQPLLGSIMPQMSLVEDETTKLGSHLFNEEDPIISAAEAVKILHALGYEAVSDVPNVNPYHTIEEIERENTTMNDDDDDNNNETMGTRKLVEEVQE